MKKILLGLLITPFVIVFSSCEDNIPEYDVRDEYTGWYQVTDLCDVGESAYDLEIFKFDNADEIGFGFPGLYETGFEVHAIVTGMKIIIPIQDFYVSSYPEIFYEFSGSGSLEGNILTIEYRVLTVQNGLITDDVDCSANMVRQ